MVTFPSLEVSALPIALTYKIQHSCLAYKTPEALPPATSCASYSSPLLLMLHTYFVWLNQPSALAPEASSLALFSALDALCRSLHANCILSCKSQLKCQHLREALCTIESKAVTPAPSVSFAALNHVLLFVFITMSALSSVAVSSHIGLLSLWNVARATEELNFLFYLVYIAPCGYWLPYCMAQL